MRAKNKFRLILGVFFLATIVFGVRYVSAAVELIYFRATGMADKILLEWETATEIDNAGFYIQRSLSSDSGFERVTDFIPSQGDPFTGQYYSYNDTTAEAGFVYYYKLEMVDNGGNSDFSDVAEAFIVGGSATPTSTLTHTPTSTLTSTLVDTPPQAETETLTPTPSSTATVDATAYLPTITPTKTVTKTHRPTYTSTPVPSSTIRPTATHTSPPTATYTPTGPTATSTATSTSTPTPTTTLDALPSITLLSLLPSVTPTPTGTSINTSTLASPPQNAVVQTPGIPLRIKLLLGIVLLLWIALAVFLVFYLERLVH